MKIIETLKANKSTTILGAGEVILGAVGIVTAICHGNRIKRAEESIVSYNAMMIAYAAQSEKNKSKLTTIIEEGKNYFEQAKAAYYGIPTIPEKPKEEEED